MYVITYRKIPLDGFYPNGLPEKSRTGISLKDIIRFSKNSYETFRTQEEAETHKRYMLHEAECESDRYDNAIPGSSIKVISLINKCAIVKEAEIAL